MTIFDLVTSAELVAYWELKTQDDEPYFGSALFPNNKKIGLTLKWLKGSKGLPVVLKPSNYDVAAIPRTRIGFEKLSAEMPFFKESMYIDEEMRQELNKVLETGNQAYIDSVMGQIFDDEIQLLRGASAQRERMRMMMLTTGTIMVEGNGQVYEYDYHMPEDHKTTVATSWSNPAADIIGDIQKAKQKILADTGVTVTRALTSDKVFSYFRQNKAIRASLTTEVNKDRFISDKEIKQFFVDALSIEIVTNEKQFIDETGATQRYVAEDIFVLFPSGQLGQTWFGTTPEESDLMTSNVANVSITDTGVAVTTMQKADPVQVETKVTQICLPDFPTADQVYILDVIAE